MVAEVGPAEAGLFVWLGQSAFTARSLAHEIGRGTHHNPLVLIDRAQTRLLSNLGWIDHGSIWALDIESGQISHVPIGSGEYVRIYPGRDDLFAAALFTSSGTSWMTVTVRSAAAPAEIRARWEAPGGRVEGSADDWSRVPHVFVGHVPAEGIYMAVSVEPMSGAVEMDRLDWFDESYDWGYQAPITVCRVPGSGLLLFSVQRSSDLVLYDPRTRTVQRKVPLADRHGNPDPVFRTSAQELWAVDYDTLVRVDPATWQVTNATRLQAADNGTMQFVGGFSFDAGERRCVIARPFSSDAVVLDTSSFEPIGAVRLGKQPLEVALLTDGRTFARDWQTGELLSGRLTNPP
jgi:hypothetical protein